MSVLVVTSVGDLVVDLFTSKCPLTSKNFLKLCKIKYYNGCLFHTVQKDFTAQTGDPSGKGTGGDSVYKVLYGDQARFFSDEIHLELKHSKTGIVAMASAGENLNASQFYITLRDDLDYLDGKHTVFGELAEGFDTLTRINEAYVDEKGRPYKNIRIKHTYILEDPFDDPPQLAELIPEASPTGRPKEEVEDYVRLEDDWVPLDEHLDPAQLEEVIKEKAAHSSATVLELVGDIPDADVKPPDNVLFVCKLNPVTDDEDLHTIFSRFGHVVSAEIIRDYKTGDSLCYAFIEFETTESCEQAYFKMDNALIDDRRIHVDFSQSVSKLWSRYRLRDQQPKGKGCYSCGSLDHIAKDCTHSTSKDAQEASKYILKDEGNNQRGGADVSRYDMVFEDDPERCPRRTTSHEPGDRDERESSLRTSSISRHGGFKKERRREDFDYLGQSSAKREGRDKKSSSPIVGRRHGVEHESVRNFDRRSCAKMEGKDRERRRSPVEGRRNDDGHERGSRDSDRRSHEKRGGMDRERRGSPVERWRNDEEHEGAGRDSNRRKQIRDEGDDRRYVEHKTSRDYGRSNRRRGDRDYEREREDHKKRYVDISRNQSDRHDD